MITLYEEGEESAAFVRMLLKITDLEPEDMARLINVKPATLYRWLEGQPIDLGCAHFLLDLIARDPSAMVYMLAELSTQPPTGLPWAQKLAAIQRRLGYSKTGMVELLNTRIPAYTKWTNGETEPSSCYQPLIDLLYLHTDSISELLARPPAPAAVPWTKARLQTLLARLGTTYTGLMALLDLSPSTYSAWVHGKSAPGNCIALFLDLLEQSPKQTLRMIQQADISDPESWSADRLRAVRQAAGLTMGELTRIYGMDHDTLTIYEREGLITPKGCPLLFYTILERDPKGFLKLIAELR